MLIIVILPSSLASQNGTSENFKTWKHRTMSEAMERKVTAINEGHSPQQVQA